MKHVHVTGASKEIVWECDSCHVRFPHVRGKPPARCVVCEKDLCKSCKRHIHVETGTGNGRPIPEQINITRNLCPEHFGEVVRPVFRALALEVPRGESVAELRSGRRLSSEPASLEG